MANSVDNKHLACGFPFRGRGAFESVYSPELVGGDVVFTDYELIVGKPRGEQWAQFRGNSQSFPNDAKNMRYQLKRISEYTNRDRG